MYKSAVIIAVLAYWATALITVKPNKYSNPKTDTTFIVRKVKKNYYHAIFIEKNTQSEYYKFALSFKMDSYELPDYKEECRDLKKHLHKPLKTFNLASLPKQWVPLYLYKGKYYVYAPSDAGNLGRRIITDSTLVYWYMDGILPEPLYSAKKINTDTYSFKVHQYFPDEKTTHLIIHIIDPKNKIAVWEDTSQPVSHRYSLYVPKQYAKNFDMVVNYNVQNKEAEFQFDKIDYQALLRGK